MILIFVGVLCLDFLTLRNTHKSHIWHIIGSLLLIDKFHLFKAIFFMRQKEAKFAFLKLDFGQCLINRHVQKMYNDLHLC